MARVTICSSPLMALCLRSCVPTPSLCRRVLNCGGRPSESESEPLKHKGPGLLTALALPLLPALIHRSAWKGDSPKFALPPFSVVRHSLGPGVVRCSVTNKIGGAITAYLSEEQQRQRTRELVRKKTGLDWPTLKVGDIEKAMSSVTLFYWCTKEDVGKRGHQKQLELTDEEAESIAID